MNQESTQPFKSIDILFENASFVAVDKPPGWLSVPSRIGTQDLRPCLGKILEEIKQIQIYPVNRLDQEVGGLILYAKEQSAHRIASQWFENREIVKIYQAFCLSLQGSFPKPNESFLWKSHLVRGKKRAYERPFGKSAVTQATFLKTLSLDGTSVGLWQLEPKTGRPHQLRFEMYKRSYPVLGDLLYGCPKQLINPPMVALRSTGLNFSKCSGYVELGLPAQLEAATLIDWWSKNSLHKSVK